MRNGEYMIYHSIQDLLNLAKEYQIPLWEVVCRADMEERQVTKEQSFETMHRMYEAMKQADSAYDKNLKSASGLAGGDGEKLHCYNAAGKNIAGEYIGLVMEKAVKMGESNACMKRIVAAPTAGACGVIPAVFLAYQEYFRAEEQKMVEAMYLTAGIGAVIAENASIAGASGGCHPVECIKSSRDVAFAWKAENIFSRKKHGWSSIRYIRKRLLLISQRENLLIRRADMGFRAKGRF